MTKMASRLLIKNHLKINFPGGCWMKRLHSGELSTPHAAYYHLSLSCYFHFNPLTSCSEKKSPFSGWLNACCIFSAANWPGNAQLWQKKEDVVSNLASLTELCWKGCKWDRDSVRVEARGRPIVIFKMPELKIRSKMMRSENQKDLLCTINTYFPPHHLIFICLPAELSASDGVTCLFTLGFCLKKKGFHRASTLRQSLPCVNLQRFQKRGRERSMMPSIN